MADTETAPRNRRIEGIDVARGLASAIMIQGHAYDGWVRPEDKASAAYLFTRVLGTLPLPSFLVLAGAAMTLRIGAAADRGEAPSVVRRALVRRGLTIVLIGYLVNAVSALMDGFEDLSTFTRADVLGVIGLSIAAIAMLGVRGGASIDLRWLDRAAWALVIVPVAICAPLSAWSADVTGPMRHLLAPFVDIPGVSLMPFVPLASWAGVGVLLTRLLVRANVTARSIGGAPDRVLLAVAAVALLIVVTFSWLTGAWVEASGTTLSRAHPAVIANAIELAARGVLVLAIGGLLTPRLPAPIKRVLLRFGRGSLWAYVFHVPFCYGALGLPVRGRLTMLEATGLVMALEIASYGVVVLRDVWTERRTRAKAAAA
jgi:uncharacterized membrane protein